MLVRIATYGIMMAYNYTSCSVVSETRYTTTDNTTLSMTKPAHPETCIPGLVGQGGGTTVG